MNGVLLWSAVGAVGGLGALARFELDGLVQLRATGEFPLGTFVVNASGTFVLGLLTGLSITGDAVLLAGTGFLGSFTTFSTWMLETERLAEDGESRLAFANLVLSLLGGAAAAVAGWAIGAVL
ncbi:MAG TPA: fluoride efflux transporter CrcB [Gaiellaceae bacterium]|nr:fluoride efflux transporter CrcB [Gaiellaceae bacterium]